MPPYATCNFFIISKSEFSKKPPSDSCDYLCSSKVRHPSLTCPQRNLYWEKFLISCSAYMSAMPVEALTDTKFEPEEGFKKIYRFPYKIKNYRSDFARAFHSSCSSCPRFLHSRRPRWWIDSYIRILRCLGSLNKCVRQLNHKDKILIKNSRIHLKIRRLKVCFNRYSKYF